MPANLNPGAGGRKPRPRLPNFFIRKTPRKEKPLWVEVGTPQTPVESVANIDDPVMVFRRRKFKTSRGNVVLLSGKRKGRAYSLTQHYAKLSVNQEQAKRQASWVDQRRDALQYPNRAQERALRKRSPESRVIIRTHNKEYSQRIENQMKELRHKDIQRKSFVNKYAEFLRDARKRMKKGLPVEKVGSKIENQIITDILEIIKQANAGAKEEAFFRKRPKTLAGKLARKRVLFFGENISKAFALLDSMEEHGVLNSDFFRRLDEATRSESHTFYGIERDWRAAESY